MKKFFTTLLLALIPFFVVAQTISLPFSYDGGKESLPEGVKGEGLGKKDYLTSPHIKFDKKNSRLTFNLPEHNGVTFWFDRSMSKTAKDQYLIVETSINNKKFNKVERVKFKDIKETSFSKSRYAVSIPNNVKAIRLSFEKHGKATMGVGNFHIEKGVSFTITDAEYATFYSDKNVYLPPMLKASIIEADGNGIKVKELEEQVVNANTAVILQAKAGIYTAEPNVKATDAEKFNGNILKGSLTDEEVKAEAGQKLYVLTTGSKGVGFYWQQGTQGNSAKVGLGHAYLFRPFTSGGVQGFSLVDPIVTGVETVETQNTEEDVPIYDLSGRRVTHPTHGIYIIGGKKVMR